MLFDTYPIKRVELSDSSYPPLLRSIPNPPSRLYYRGDLSCLSDNCLSIVGTRKISPYGVAALEHIFKDLACSRLTVVSGFMRGVDVFAHELAVEYGGKTVAVLPCGLDLVQPSSSMELYRKILESGGAVVSEYDGAQQSRDWMFVKRNRIVAGLSSCLLVAEASVNSGSLITYEYAKRYKRKVFAVPCDIFRESGLGICQILRDGAAPVFSGLDINKEFGIDYTPIRTFDVEADEVIFALSEGPLDADSLSTKLSIPITDLNIKITNLILAGHIKENGGYYYVVKS